MIALPILPIYVVEELEGAKQYYIYKERCVFCDIIRQETDNGIRVVAENEDFLTIAPYAPRFPFETWILPKRHESAFENSSSHMFENLAKALKNLQHGSIAPVDLAQASIGPGMAIYSRYSKIIESDGTPLSVRTALQLINRSLDEVLAEQEGEYDAENGLICSFPVRLRAGKAEVVRNVPINEFSRGKIDASVNELKEEKSLVTDLLGAS